MKERLVRFGQFLRNTPWQRLYILFDLLLSIPAHTNHSLDGPSPGDDVVTINNGTIIGKDIVDQRLDLFPTGFQDLLQEGIPDT